MYVCCVCVYICTHIHTYIYYISGFSPKLGRSGEATFPHDGNPLGGTATTKHSWEPAPHCGGPHPRLPDFPFTPAGSKNSLPRRHPNPAPAGQRSQGAPPEKSHVTRQGDLGKGRSALLQDLAVLRKEEIHTGG